MSVHGPPKYVNAPIPQPSAGVGYSMPKPNDMMIRPMISRINGGRRKGKQTKRNNKRTNQKGGFLPSIGQSFAAAVSKYLAPLAMYGMYKFVTRKNKNNKNSNNKRRSTRRR